MYVDVLFVLNFSMNVLSLYLTEKLCGNGLLGLRCFLAGGIGALAGILLTISMLPGWSDVLLALAISFLMVYISFGGCGGFFHFLRCSGILWGVTVMFGGTTLFLMERIASVPNRGELFMVLVVGCGISTVIWRVICWKKQRVSAFVSVELDGKTCEFPALCDSGNLVREPISGLPVVMLSEEIARGLLPGEILEHLSSGDVNRVMELPEMLRRRVRVIPLSTATGRLTVCGILPDRISVAERAGKREVQALVVIRPLGISGFGGYAGVIPASLGS